MRGRASDTRGTLVIKGYTKDDNNDDDVGADRGLVFAREEGN